MLDRLFHKNIPAVALAIFVLSLVCFLGGIHSFKSLQNAFSNTSTFAMENSISLSPDDIEDTSKTMPLVLWSQINNSSISTENKSNVENIALIVFEGDQRLLLPDLATHVENRNCIVSTTASLLLFGSKNSVGSRVLINGRDYDVCENLSSTDSFVVVPNDDRVFPLTRITTLELNRDGFFVDSLILSSDLSTKVELLDFRMLSLISYLLLLLYPLTLILCVSFISCRGTNRRNAAPLIKLLYLVLPCIAFIALTATFAASLETFGSYYPGRWSSSTEWLCFFQALFDNIQTFATTPLTIFDARGMKALFLILLFSFLSIILLLCSLRKFATWNSVWHAKHCACGILEG